MNYDTLFLDKPSIGGKGQLWIMNGTDVYNDNVNFNVLTLTMNE